VPNRPQRIDECLEATWLAEKRDTLCEGLSRGMKQRLVLAKTLLPDPQVLLLDEPASGLDPLGRIELWKLLLHLHDAGKAVLLSACLITELSSFSNKAAVLDRGRLLAFGEIDELARQLNHQRISVKWLANGGRAREILDTAAGIGRISPNEHGAVFDFEGGPAALHELLRVMIMQDVHVTEWRTAEDDLEQSLVPRTARI
jgi:ABC-2 type transport system ATP-binding protein